MEVSIFSIFIFLSFTISKKNFLNGERAKRRHQGSPSKVVKKDTIPWTNWVRGKNGKSYAITQNKNGYYKSSDICENTRSYLANIMSMTDQETVNDVIKQQKPANEEFLWIGMNVEGARQWKWQRNSLIVTNFMNWSPGQPSSSNGLQDCGALGQDGTWFSIGCDQLHYGLCEKMDEEERLMSQLAAALEIPPSTKPQTSFLLNETKNGVKAKTGNDAQPQNEKLMEKGQMEEKKINSDKENQNTKEKKKSENEVKCNLINFTNNYGHRVLLTRNTNNGDKKEFLIDGESYKLNTMFKKVQNIGKMEPVVYTATDEKTGKKLLLDESDKFTLMPGDCDDNFVNVAISHPEKIKGHLLHNGARSEKPRDSINNEEQHDGDKSSKKCKVETFGGNSDEMCCQFPFKLNGRMHYDCTLFNSKHMWCATTHNYDKDERWGYCCQGGDCAQINHIKS